MRWLVPMVLGAMFLASAPAVATEWIAKLAQEYDSNPARLDGDGSEDDGASRLLLSATGHAQVGERISVDANGRFGGRFFYRTPSEDSAGLVASGRVMQRLREHGALGLTTDVRDRWERRSYRDYRTLRGGLTGQAWTDRLRWTGAVTAAQFAYKPNDALSWSGPGGNTGLEWRPGEAPRLSLRYAYVHKRHREDRFDIGINGGRFVEEGVARVDQAHTLGFGIGWVSPRLVVDLRYSYARNDSNSATKSYTRHSVDPSLTFLPFGDLLLRLTASVQRTNFDQRGAIDESLLIDDEIRNSVGGNLEHPLGGDWVFVEAGYNFYGQAIQGDVSAPFRRHLAYVGFSVRSTDQAR